MSGTQWYTPAGGPSKGKSLSLMWPCSLHPSTTSMRLQAKQKRASRSVTSNPISSRVRNKASHSSRDRYIASFLRRGSRKAIRWKRHWVSVRSAVHGATQRRRATAHLLPASAASKTLICLKMARRTCACVLSSRQHASVYACSRRKVFGWFRISESTFGKISSLSIFSRASDTSSTSCMST